VSGGHRRARPSRPSVCDRDPFVGAWALASAGEGMTTVTSNGQSDSAAYPGMVTWVAGTSTDLVQTAAGWTTFLGCTISANVSDHTAAETSTETCAFLGEGNLDCLTETALRYHGREPCVSNGQQYPISLVSTISAYSFVVAADGLTATETASGDVEISDPNNPGGRITTCSWTATAGPYMKQ
jgi:hypothetical protein